MLFVLKIVVSFILLFALNQVFKINKQNNENLKMLKQYEFLNDYYGFDGYTSNYFKLDSNNKYFSENNSDFDKYNAKNITNAYYISYTYYDFVQFDGDVKEQLNEIEDDYNKNYVEVNSNFANDFITYSNLKDFKATDIVLLVPMKYKANTDEITSTYETTLKDTKQFYEDYYKVSIDQQATIKEVKYYDGNIISQTNKFNTSEVGKINRDTIFVINSNLITSPIINADKYFYRFNNFDDFYSLFHSSGLSDILVPANKLAPYKNMINENKVILMWNTTAIIIMSLLFIALALNTIYFYLTANKKSHAIKLLFGYSYLKIFKNHAILNTLILLNIPLGIMLNYNTSIILIVAITFIIDTLLLYIIGIKKMRQNISDSINGG
ncbi:MAG: DUF1430 domain-containing protein [Bacilli bacterium]